MNKTALITGATSGIGKELAYIHAKKGNDLFLIARSEKNLAQIKDDISSKLNVDVKYTPFDLTHINQLDAFINNLLDSGIKIDYLINNAGITEIKSVENQDWESIHKIIQLNITALTKICHAFVPHLKENKGKILNVASVASFQPIPLQAVYAASKAYVLNFSIALHEELSPYGVTVTSLCPGITDTNMSRSVNASEKILNNKLITQSRKEVATVGYKAMIKGKPVAISGSFNKLNVNIANALPKSWVAKINKFGFERALKK